MACFFLIRRKLHLFYKVTALHNALLNNFMESGDFVDTRLLFVDAKTVIIIFKLKPVLSSILLSYDFSRDLSYEKF